MVCATTAALMSRQSSQHWLVWILKADLLNGTMYFERNEIMEHQFIYACICLSCSVFLFFMSLALTPSDNWQSRIFLRMIPFALGIASLFVSGKLFELF